MYLTQYMSKLCLTPNPLKFAKPKKGEGNRKHACDHALKKKEV